MSHAICCTVLLLVLVAMATYPGPFCEKNNLSTEVLDHHDFSEVSPNVITNGLVFELKKYYNSAPELLSCLQKLNPAFDGTSTRYLQTKIKRLLDVKRKLTRNGKVKGFQSVTDCLEKHFGPPSLIHLPSSNKGAPKPTTDSFLNSLSASQLRPDQDEPTIPGATDTAVANSNTFTETSGYSSATTNVEANIVLGESPTCETAEDDVNIRSTYRSSPKKRDNTLAHEIEKKEKHLLKLAQDVQRREEYLDRRNKLIGHYSVKNVNKRDETAKKNCQILRETQRQLLKEKKQYESVNVKVQNLKRIVGELRKENGHLKDKISDSDRQGELLESEIKKKVAAQKSASHWKTTVLKLRQLNIDNVQEVQQVHVHGDDVQDEIQLTFEENLAQRLVTKRDDGTYMYQDNIRLCVMELASFEVAVEKISQVISTVSRHLLNYEIPIKDLPNRTTTQSIVDEGHYLAKTYVADKLDQSENWGLNRDGTSRKKKKLLDTSVTLSDGQIISLGFSRVAHESAVAINEVTKEHLVELSRMQTVKDQTKEEQPEHDQDYICRTLQKLAYTMSDRAGNEKLATKMLVEWREQLLKDSIGEDEIQTVHSFHCMAHVLLGFHSYAAKDLKVLETQIAEDLGPLGRDALPVFRFWNRTGTVVERVVRTASDVFGPVGDYRGVRDRWEAHCKAEGIKSIIGNYKDNRFNALFETSAEVFIHREDFLTVINSVQKPNLKLQAVRSDLQHPVVRVLLQSFGLIYLKVTGPFWNMVTCGNIPYLLLYPHIQKLLEFLQLCTTDPANILNMDGHWTADDPHGLYDVPNRNQLMSLFNVADEHRDSLMKCVSVVAQAMTKTIQKQLNDFVEDGKYASEPLAADLHRTSFAHVNNLGCEHHFGDLDSSQRRRPNSSLHHHSSIQLLKRNRSGLMEWMQNMDREEKTKMMKAARKEGKTLRNLHIQREKNVLNEIQEEMQNIAQPKKRRRKNNQEPEACDRPINEEPEHEDERFDIADKLNRALPQNNRLKENSYVVVAYQDNWYPGIVLEKKSDDSAKVKFLVPTNKEGVFKWPARDDIQEVASEFVIKCDISVECISSGRQWRIQDYSEIQSVYDMFSLVHF